MQGTTDDADLDRQFNFTTQTTGIVRRSTGQRTVPTGTSRIRMGAGFNGSPVLAQGYRDSVDAVHDTFVMRDSPHHIEFGEFAGVGYASTKLGTEGVFRELGAHSNHATKGQVAEDSQTQGAVTEIVNR